MRTTLLLLAMPGIHAAAQTNAALRLTSKAFVPDREFPELLRYCVESWDLRAKLNQTKTYAEEIKPGAMAHLFVRNTSGTTQEIRQVFLNDIDLAEQLVPRGTEHLGLPATSYWLNDAATTPPGIKERLDRLGAPVWFQVRPNPVPPGQTAQVMVRLRRVPQEKSLELKLRSSSGNTIVAHLSTDEPAALTVAAVNFSAAIDRVYLYLRRTDGKEFALQSVSIDGTNAPLASDSPRRSMHGFLPLELRLPAPWKHGSFHHIQAMTADGMTAGAVVRARDNFFVLGMWGYRNSGNTLADKAADTSSAFQTHLFNTHMNMAGDQSKYIESAEGLQMLAAKALRLMAYKMSEQTVAHENLYARFLVDEPDAHDAKVTEVPADLRVGSYAQALVSRQQEWTRTDPRTLNLLNLDLTYKPENWLTYGQLPDILCIDPYFQYIMREIWTKNPGRFGSFSHPYFVFAASEIARWAGEPRPLHVILNSVAHHVPNSPVFRYGTPEEKRIEFYYALAAGAKGISYWWFTPYGEYRGCGSDDPGAQAMMHELARLNAEVRAVEPLLGVAAPGTVSGGLADPFASASPYWLITRTLFAGTDTAVVILVNRNHASDRLGSEHQPIPKARVTFQSPPWLKPVSAFRVSSRGVHGAPFARDERSLSVQLDDIDLAEMLLLTADPALEAMTQGRWTELQPRLEAATQRPGEAATENRSSPVSPSSGGN